MQQGLLFSSSSKLVSLLHCVHHSCGQDVIALYAADLMLLLCAGLSLMPVQGSWCLAGMIAVCTCGSLATILLWMTVQWHCGSIPEKSMLLT